MQHFFITDVSTPVEIRQNATLKNTATYQNVSALAPAASISICAPILSMPAHLPRSGRVLPQKILPLTKW